MGSPANHMADDTVDLIGTGPHRPDLMSDFRGGGGSRFEGVYRLRPRGHKLSTTSGDILDLLSVALAHYDDGELDVL